MTDSNQRVEEICARGLWIAGFNQWRFFPDGNSCFPYFQTLLF